MVAKAKHHRLQLVLVNCMHDRGAQGTFTRPQNASDHGKLPRLPLTALQARQVKKLIGYWPLSKSCQTDQDLHGTR